MLRGKLFAVLAALFAVCAVVVPGGPAGAAAQVNGSGSTWSAIAVTQWATDVARQGLSINFTPNGSSNGRKFYIENQSDFAVSEIPFQPELRDRDGNILYDEIQRAKARPYAYMPIVAGGTSFMYHLEVGGKRVTDLRLSGETVTKIFTGVITNWNDPAITKDNNGRTFPSKTIKPIVRSDGSGTSAQFSLYMSKRYSSLYCAFYKKMGLSPCLPTSLYPIFPGSQAQSGSDGVASAVAAPYNDGAITYVEYGYAKQRGFPVASVQNQAGYFTQPTALNVAIALARAQIKSDRTQVLDGVYTNPDPRTYPVSSYSYMIVPTSEAGIFTKAKGDVLGKFILYFLCTGQQKAEQLGYSPLPKNLVQYGFDAESQIPGAPKPPPINSCANPTITGAFNKDKAPPPAADTAPGYKPPSANQGGRIGGGDTTTTTLASSDNGTGPTDQGSSDAAGTGGSQQELNQQNVASVGPASVAPGDDQVPTGIYVGVIVLLLAVVFGPPAMSAALRRRRSD
ncbi:MAG: phosphate ABC transporter substrate-binding protein PstS [Acidimicrobiia bacterium]|nr:phosphate ABC transporter substrate-binding protein PstS [Acidimicrobiia bacterium]